MKLGQKEIDLLKRFAEEVNSYKTIENYRINDADIIDFVGRENLRLPVSSLQLKEKHKTDFDVWAINKGYTKMEGEWVKEPETYNEEFLLQMYNEELESL